MQSGEIHISVNLVMSALQEEWKQGAKWLFQRSIEKHNLHYVEYLRDSKSYLSVKNVYEGLEIKK